MMPTSVVQPRMSDRRFSLLGLLVIFAVLFGAVDAALVVRAIQPAPPPAVSWWLADGFPAGPRFDPSQAQTMTVVPIDVAWLDMCLTNEQNLILPPEIRYTEKTVVITIRLNLSPSEISHCFTVVNGKVSYARMLDTGIPLEVHLDQPLRGRTLLDGEVDPPITPGQY